MNDNEVIPIRERYAALNADNGHADTNGVSLNAILQSSDIASAIYTIAMNPSQNTIGAVNTTVYIKTTEGIFYTLTQTNRRNAGTNFNVHDAWNLPADIICTKGQIPPVDITTILNNFASNAGGGKSRQSMKKSKQKRNRTFRN